MDADVFYLRKSASICGSESLLPHMILTTSNPGLCSGGNHFGVDVTVGARTKRVEFGRDELQAPLDVEEIRQMVLTLLKLEWRAAGASNPGNQAAAFRAAIANKSWDL